MDICIVSGIFPPDIGGPASYVPKIANTLIEQGHSAEIVCLSDSLAHDDLNDYPFKVTRIQRSLPKYRRSIEIIHAICRSAKNANLIYVNGLSLESMIAALISKKPTIHKVVGDYAWERAQLWRHFTGTLDEYQTTKKNLKLKVLDFIRTAPLRKSHSIIVPSKYLKKIVIGWGISSKKLRVIYNAIDIPNPQTDLIFPKVSGKAIVTVGRLVPWKGVDGILNVLSQIKDCHLVIIGEGPLRNELEILCHKLNLEDRVTFMGALSKSQVTYCLEKADLFVLNSTYEGLPHVVLEAMKAGTPVVATDAGGTSEVIQDRENGLLVSVGNEEKLKECIQKILAEPKYAQQLANQAYNDVNEKFSLENMLKESIQVFSQV